jgi:group II intron reverse transcriptase/maturase
MITPSHLRTAFLSVKENHGCAGVDGITIGRFERDLDRNLAELAYEIEHDAYLPRPLLRILVAKKNGEPRQLCIPAVRDRVVQRAVLDTIEPVMEKEFEHCSFAYRKGRSIRQVVQKIQELYNDGFRWVVDADIDAFFDNVDHDLLIEKFNRLVDETTLRAVVGQWVKAEVWDGKQVRVLSKGIPQGSAISPILANLFLDEPDEAMLAEGYRYIRYADDYVILCKSREKAFKGLALSKEALAEMKLVLDDEEVTHFDKGFKYLGVVFLRSMVMKPYETQMKRRKVLYFPPPFNMKAWLVK